VVPERSGETADGTTGYRVAAERQAVATVATEVQALKRRTGERTRASERLLV
jgi:hypothetical protein